MKQLIVGLYAIPVLLVIGASAAPMEQKIVILCGALTCAVTLVITCLLLGLHRSKQQRPWPVLVGAATCLAIIASVMTVHWPLRGGYYLSRASLDQLAQNVRAGQPFVGPSRIGLFTIVEAEISQHGIVCLWVNADPSGKTGFVQCNPDYVPFNLWSMVSLDDRWQFISED